MLDHVILTMMLAACGVSDAEAKWVLPQIIEAAQELYQTGVPDLRDKLCPGLPHVLEEMTRRKVVLALVTGNLTRIGEGVALGRIGAWEPARYILFFLAGAVGATLATSTYLLGAMPSIAASVGASLWQASRNAMSVRFMEAILP